MCEQQPSQGMSDVLGLNPSGRLSVLALTLAGVSDVHGLNPKRDVSDIAWP